MVLFGILLLVVVEFDVPSRQKKMYTREEIVFNQLFRLKWYLDQSCCGVAFFMLTGYESDIDETHAKKLNLKAEQNLLPTIILVEFQ